MKRRKQKIHTFNQAQEDFPHPEHPHIQLPDQPRRGSHTTPDGNMFNLKSRPEHIQALLQECREEREQLKLDLTRIKADLSLLTIRRDSTKRKLRKVEDEIAQLKLLNETEMKETEWLSDMDDSTCGTLHARHLALMNKFHQLPLHTPRPASEVVEPPSLSEVHPESPSPATPRRDTPKGKPKGIPKRKGKSHPVKDNPTKPPPLPRRSSGIPKLKTLSLSWKNRKKG